jgi:3',5'-cyclic AMP phosphodiesterase CpdA
MARTNKSQTYFYNANPDMPIWIEGGSRCSFHRVALNLRCLRLWLWMWRILLISCSAVDAPEILTLSEPFGEGLMDSSVLPPTLSPSVAPPKGDTGTVNAEISDNRWSIVVLPDTQNSIENDLRVIESQVTWILDNRELLRIRHVIHTGDIVSRNMNKQWEAARKALAPLVESVPTLAVPGNHDLGDRGSANRRISFMDDYLSQPFFQSKHTPFGWFESERSWNGFHGFEERGRRWLILGLEFMPRPEVVTWANQVIAEHSDHFVIVFTHSFLYSDDERYDYATRGERQCWDEDDYGLADSDEGLDGQQLYDRLLSKHDNVRFVFSAHVIDTSPTCGVTRSQARMCSLGLGGNPIHQLLANYQEWPHSSDIKTGQGYLRLMVFSASKVRVHTYSPWLNKELEDKDNQFELSPSQCD